MARQTTLQKSKAHPVQTVPFRGGCKTAVEPVLLPTGSFSMVQNMRNQHPGMIKRAGQSKFNSSPNGTNKIVSLFNYSKSLSDADYLLTQLGTGEVLSSDVLPTSTPSTLGTTKLSAISTPIPASWSALNDNLIFSDGTRQHQIWPVDSSTWRAITNNWDTVLLDGVEVQKYTNSTGAYYIYGGLAVDVSLLTSSDFIYVAVTDPVLKFYIDPGVTPNLTSSAIVNFEYHDGTGWHTVSITDGTNGLKNAGWVTLAAHTPVSFEFNNSQYTAFWYRFQLSNAISDSISIAIQYVPIFNITDFGTIGICSQSWKGRIVYTFSIYPDYLYISAVDSPEVLNGLDYGIIQVGDGRSNKVAAMRKFHNELMVWQKEKGEAGGSLTLIEGYSPTTFGKLILSSRLGTMNNKTVAIVDGVTWATTTTESIKTIAFALSRYGVYATDGRTCWMIDADISNYFDPTADECIRRGYENEMWLAYDSAYNVLRLGLVSGGSATLPNIFPVFDLTDKTWSFDVLGQRLSCMTEVGAITGDVPVVQAGGGQADGTVYLLNDGVNDVSTAIDSFVRQEIDFRGLVMVLREMILRTKDGSGSCSVTAYSNNIAKGTKVIGS